MDAVDFIVNFRRMCSVDISCDNCLLRNSVYCNDKISKPISRENAESAVEIVEKWAKENSTKTKQSEFLKQFPNAKMICGVLNVCPFSIGLIDECEADGNVLCYDCRKNFWLSEIKD